MTLGVHLFVDLPRRTCYDTISYSSRRRAVRRRLINCVTGFPGRSWRPPLSSQWPNSNLGRTSHPQPSSLPADFPGARRLGNAHRRELSDYSHIFPFFFRGRNDDDRQERARYVFGRDFSNPIHLAETGQPSFRKSKRSLDRPANRSFQGLRGDGKGNLPTCYFPSHST